MTAEFRGMKIQLHTILNPSMYDTPNDKIKYAPGTIVFKKINSKFFLLMISCKDNSWIHISKVHVEGKRIVNAFDFINGYVFESGSECLL